MVQKLERLKTAHSVKVGGLECLFLDDKSFDITLTDTIIRIQDRASKAVAYTSLANTVWFTLKEEDDKIAKTEDTARTPKKKSSKKQDSPK